MQHFTSLQLSTQATFPGELLDSHLLALAKTISRRIDLLTLGVQILEQKPFVVDVALTDNRAIQEAAYAVLSAWRGQQTTGQEAYRALHAGLLAAKWSSLAADLQVWVERPQAKDAIDLPPERK